MSQGDLKRWLAERRNRELREVAIHGELEILAQQFRLLMQGAGLTLVSEVQGAIRTFFDGGPWRISILEEDCSSLGITVRIWCGPADKFVVTMAPPAARDGEVWINVRHEEVGR